MIDAERAYARPKFRAMIKKPFAQRLRKQGRHGEVPEEHPDEQRHVSEELDIKSRGPTKGRNRYRTKRAGNNSQGHGEKPSEHGELNGCDKPLKEPGAGLAGPKYAPVEMIVHLRSRHWAMQNQPLVGATGRSPLHGQEATCSISAPAASAGIAWSRA